MSSLIYVNVRDIKKLLRNDPVMARRRPRFSLSTASSEGQRRGGGQERTRLAPIYRWPLGLPNLSCAYCAIAGGVFTHHTGCSIFVMTILRLRNAMVACSHDASGRMTTPLEARQRVERAKLSTPTTPTRPFLKRFHRGLRIMKDADTLPSTAVVYLLQVFVGNFMYINKSLRLRMWPHASPFIGAERLVNVSIL